jgi:hypothetical protein
MCAWSVTKGRGIPCNWSRIFFGMVDAPIQASSAGYHGPSPGSAGTDTLVGALQGCLAMEVTSTRTADERRDTFSNIVCRLRHEFLGTPALALTPGSAARLWGLDRVTAVCVLDFLASQGYVREIASGVYVRCEDSDDDSCR